MAPKPAFAFQWHITDECDQRCKHCYIFANGDCAGFTRMPWSQMKEVIDQAEELCEKLTRQPYFYVTGGDPILHPDFWRLAELLHERGFMWCVMGNPFHLDDETCHRMKELGCRKYQLSLDGLEATHDYFRKPGSFADTLRAIECLKRAGIWVAIMNTVSSTNAHELPKLIDLAASLEVDVFAFGRYCPTSGQARDEFHMEPWNIATCSWRRKSASITTNRVVAKRSSSSKTIYGRCFYGNRDASPFPKTPSRA